MTKADDVIEAARVYVNKMAGTLDNAEPEFNALADSLAAYINEKPHEPQSDEITKLVRALEDESGHHMGRHTNVDDYVTLQVLLLHAANVLHRYASPSAQPIAREPTGAMIDAALNVTPSRDMRILFRIWYAMYDAALKSAGKEST